MRLLANQCVVFDKICFFKLQYQKFLSTNTSYVGKLVIFYVLSKLVLTRCFAMSVENWKFTNMSPTCCKMPLLMVIEWTQHKKIFPTKMLLVLLLFISIELQIILHTEHKVEKTILFLVSSRYKGSMIWVKKVNSSTNTKWWNTNSIWLLVHYDILVECHHMIWCLCMMYPIQKLWEVLVWYSIRSRSECARNSNKLILQSSADFKICA